MYEQNGTPEGTAAQQQDAIDVNDFVFAATGARVRRVTLPDGEHWFPAVDVAMRLGYANTRQALLWHVAPDCAKRLSEIAQGVYAVDTSRKLAAHRLQKSMRMVNLRGLIALVNGCTKPECAPFKAWVAEVIATIQRDGSYSLDPAPVQPAAAGGTAYVMPKQVADAIVRLEERNIRADELLAAAQAERIEQMRRGNDLLGVGNDLLGVGNDLLAESVRVQHSVADALNRIADGIDRLADRLRPASADAEKPAMTPQQLLSSWRARNLVVTDDVHAVAAYLAPALLRGAARYRVEQIADRTGLSRDRVHDCVRMLIKRGCMRQVGSGADGTPVYVLP
jgi:prophage antirepressor-like protein